MLFNHFAICSVSLKHQSIGADDFKSCGWCCNLRFPTRNSNNSWYTGNLERCLNVEWHIAEAAGKLNLSVKSALNERKRTVTENPILIKTWRKFTQHKCLSAWQPIQKPKTLVQSCAETWTLKVLWQLWHLMSDGVRELVCLHATGTGLFTQ